MGARRCEGKKLLASPVKLRDIFRARPLLNALRQQTARESKGSVSLDELKLDCAWGEGATLPNCKLSLAVSGCIMQACSIENGRLAELAADSPNFHPVPPFRIGYTTESTAKEGVVYVPVYLDSSRAYWVMDLPVPCSGAAAKWILTGVAIFFEQ